MYANPMRDRYVWQLLNSGDGARRAGWAASAAPQPKPAANGADASPKWRVALALTGLEPVVLTLAWLALAAGMLWA